MPQTYTPEAKWFHWLIVLLVLIDFITAWTMEVKRGVPPGTLVNIHMSFGVLIIAVMLVRLLWRIAYPPPPMPEGTPAWQNVSAYLMHYALYILLFLAPFVGWIMVNAFGWQVLLFGFIPLPELVAKGPPFTHQLVVAHAFLATAILVLVGFHVLASLYHWYFIEDDVMERMLPADTYTTRALKYLGKFRR